MSGVVLVLCQVSGDLDLDWDLFCPVYSAISHTVRNR